MWPKGASADSELLILYWAGQQSHLKKLWDSVEGFVPLAPNPPY